MKAYFLLLLALLCPSAPVRVEGPEAQAAWLSERVPRLVLEVENALGFTSKRPITVRLTRTPGEFEAEVGRKPEWAAAVAFARQSLLVVRLDAVGPERASDISGVLRHEIVHLLLPERLGFAPVPLWFEEGLAQQLAGRINRSDLDLLPGAALTGRLLPLSSISASFPAEADRAALAYAQGESVVGRLIEQYGRAELLDAIARAGGLDGALAEFGTSVTGVEADWREWLSEERPWWSAILPGMILPLLFFVASLLAVAATLRARRRAKKTYEELPD